jgi:hypothetical protein
MDVENKRSSGPVHGVRDFFVQFAVFFIMLSYPLLSMIWRNKYPLFSVELLLFFTSILMLALLLAALTTASRPWLANVICALSMTLILVLQFDLLLEGFAALFAIIVMLALVAGTKFRQFALAVFIALIIGAYIDSRLDHASNYGQVNVQDQGSPLPLVVHILLDELICPD